MTPILVHNMLPDDLQEWRLLRSGDRVYATSRHGGTDIYTATRGGLRAIINQAREIQRFSRTVDPVKRGAPREIMPPDEMFWRTQDE